MFVLMFLILLLKAYYIDSPVYASSDDGLRDSVKPIITGSAIQDNTGPEPVYNYNVQGEISQNNFNRLVDSVAKAADLAGTSLIAGAAASKLADNVFKASSSAPMAARVGASIAAASAMAGSLLLTKEVVRNASTNKKITFQDGVTETDKLTSNISKNLSMDTQVSGEGASSSPKDIASSVLEDNIITGDSPMEGLLNIVITITIICLMFNLIFLYSVFQTYLLDKNMELIMNLIDRIKNIKIKNFLKAQIITMSDSRSKLSLFFALLSFIMVIILSLLIILICAELLINLEDYCKVYLKYFANKKN